MTVWGSTPACRGFQQYRGFYSAASDYFTHMVGAGFGAVSLPLGTTVSAVVLVAVWSVLLPILYRISHRKLK